MTHHHSRGRRTKPIIEHRLDRFDDIAQPTPVTGA
jgi:hypothetical protein